MTTIGVMSMQRIFNYGSSLQAYSLRRLLEAADSASVVDFVDYRPGDALVVETESESSSSVARAIKKVREYGQVEARLRDKARFFAHKSSYAKKYYAKIGISSTVDYDSRRDLIVIGSDEVFNCVQSNVNVGYSTDLFGANGRSAAVSSYAGSFGNTTLDKIRSYGIEDELGESFKRFKHVSVRDRNSAEIVDELTGVEPQIHLDPTLVYDIVGREAAKIGEGRPLERPYMIVYGYSGRFSAEENRRVREYADSQGLRVVALGGLQACADEFIDCDPFVLMRHFQHADAVVTDTFHGTIFSVINEVPFATIIRQSHGHSYGNQEKLGYLLETLGVEERAYNSQDALRQTLKQEVDFRPVRELREREAQRTKEYLRSVVRGL